MIERNGEVGILFRREANEFRCGHRNLIENCVIRDNGTKKPGIGIDILGKTRDITIRNTRLENTSGESQAIGVRISEDAERVILQDNTFENCPVHIKDLSLGGKLKQCPPVVFVKRPAQGRKGTNGTMLGQRTKIGSAICVYDPKHPEQGARTIFDAPEGFIFDMSLSYDAKKVLFSFMDNIREQKDSFHIWEIDIDGTELRQLTSGPYHDGSPVYLPDGRIAFCSTRVESFSLCQDFLAAAMYVINADGSNLRRIEYNTLCDVTPYVLDDGSILFTRWEYQDKNIFCTQGLWTINPDGTRLQLFYGNTLVVPNSIYGARQIPGTRKLVCTMAPHHGRPLGAIGIIDRSKGIESPKSMVNITPEIPYEPQLAANWKIDGLEWKPGDVQYHWAYTDPWPLAEDLFLVSYGGPVKDGPQRYRLYLLNDKGQKALLYEDRATSCYCPIPLVERPLPHKLPGEAPTEAEGEGTFFVADIYRGLLDKGVKRGQIQALRIMSQVPKKYNTEGPRYHDHYPVVGYGSYYVKHYYGTVPVYTDGTAYFRAPAGVELYFIAIDADGKEIRRMGTITQLTDGETQSCIGCHESRSSAPPGRFNAMVRLRRQPDNITPPPWGAGPVDFVEQVQPVLDKYCVECHSGRRPDGGIDLSGDKSRLFSMGYKSLIDRELVEHYYINTGPTGNFQPLQSGSWVSELTGLIEYEHAGVKIDDESRRRIYVWIDSNVPYYGTWDMSRPYTMGGRDTWAEKKKTMASWYRDFETVFKFNCASCHSTKDKKAKPKINHTWINLTRPEFSRALNAHLSEEAGGLGLVKKKRNQSPPLFKNRNDPVYLAMLRAIRQGKETLDSKPRVDMPGATAVAQQRDFGRLY
jgi:mono/diheme cytochrome c family protein